MTQDDFSSIDIEVTPEQQDLMVEAFVRRNLRPESVCTYDTDRSNGTSVGDALYHAVFNEFVIEALLDQIAAQEAADPTTPAQDS
jgi:hypothetical protein